MVGGILIGVSVESSEDRDVRGDAFSLFYATAHRSAVQLAWLLTHDRAACEDVVHDAFLSLYPRFDSVQNPTAYVRASIVNGVRQRGRQAGRERARAELVAVTDVESTAGPSGGLLDAVANLSVRSRTAIVLRYWAGLSDAEIAEAMNIRPGSVRSILSRAFAQLRKDFS